MGWRRAGGRACPISERGLCEGGMGWEAVKGFRTITFM